MARCARGVGAFRPVPSRAIEWRSGGRRARLRWAPDLSHQSLPRHVRLRRGRARGARRGRGGREIEREERPHPGGNRRNPAPLGRARAGPGCRARDLTPPDTRPTRQSVIGDPRGPAGADLRLTPRFSNPAVALASCGPSVPSRRRGWMIEMMMTRYFIFSPPLYYIILSIVLSMSGWDAGSSRNAPTWQSCVHTFLSDQINGLHACSSFIFFSFRASNAMTGRFPRARY